MSDRKPPPPKATVQRRVAEVLRILLDGAEPGWDLCEFVREQEQTEGSAWHLADGDKPLSYSQIRRYAVKAEKLIAESCRASRKRLLRRHLARRRNLFAKCVSQGDMRAALAILQDEAALLNLYPPKRTQLTGKNGGPVILKIREIVAGREPAEGLPKIREEVVTNDSAKRRSDDQAPPGPESIPQI